MLQLQTPSVDGAEALSVPEVSPDGRLVADAELLFTGEFARVGNDLQLTGPDGAGLTIEDYFAADVPVALVSPQGALLTGDVVQALAGGAAVQLAQSGEIASDAQLAQAGAAIGHVETLEGSAQVLRGGALINLEVGDPVYAHDVLTTGGGSALGIVFVDNTVFAMAANGRMVLDSLIYNPGASDNSLLVNLVHGSFVFISGEIAPSGGMKVETPVASIGIRGTMVSLTIKAINGETEGSLLEDPDGELGSYGIYDKLTGELIGLLDATGSLWTLTSATGTLRYNAKTQFDFASETDLVSFATTLHSSPRDNRPGANTRPIQRGQRSSLEDGDDVLETAAGPSSFGSGGSSYEATNDYQNSAQSLFSGSAGSGISGLAASSTLDSGTQSASVPTPAPAASSFFSSFPPPSPPPAPGPSAPPNSPPTAVTLDNATVNEGEDGAVVGAITVVDPDSGESFTYAVSDDRFEVAGGQLRLREGEALDFETEPVIPLTVTVTDSAGNTYTQGFEIAVTDQADPPVVDLNGPAAGSDSAASFTEGEGSVAIVDAGAGISDNDSGNLAAVTATVTNLGDGAAESLAVSTAGTAVVADYDSASGVLTLTGGASLAEFQQVLATLTYQNTSENPTAGVRTIEVVAEDVDGLTSTVATSSVTVAGANDPPVLGNNSLTIADGESVVLSDTNLSAVDLDSPDLTYTMSGVVAGQFELLSAPSVAITSFSQSQLDAGQVLFVHDSSNQAPAYQVTVSDGELIDSSAATISFTTGNAAPVLVDNQLSLSEGGSVILTPTDLSATDADGGEADLVFTVSGVQGGHFERLSALGTPITSFTQGDVAAGAIRFVHDGGEMPPAYDVTVSDGELSDSGAAAITFTPENDPPVLVNNSLTIAEGGSVVLANANLSAADPDSANLTYTVSGVQAGQFEFASAPSVAISSFTQAELDAGQVLFVHDGSEVAPSFVVSVSDGELATDLAPAAITFTSANEPPVVDLNGADDGIDYSAVFLAGEGPVGVVDPGATVGDADSANLAALTITLANALDGSAESLEVSLEAAGALGIAVAGNGTDSLTLSGAVSPANYQELLHTLTYDNAAAAPTAGVRTIEIQANDGAASGNLSPVAVSSITVTSPGAEPPVLTANQMTVDEGGIAVLSAAELAATDPDSDVAGLVFMVSGITSGQFELVAAPGVAITSFTQAQVTAGAVRFVHDGGEAAPTYQVSVSDGALASGPVAATISFTNLNDPPLLTANILTIEEGETASLSTANLNASDPDSATLTFLVSGVQNGRFELVGNPGVAVTSFTLAEVATGQVLFVHDGSEAAPAYLVAVSDGEATSQPAPAVIEYVPVNGQPTAGNDAVATDEDTAVIGSVLADNGGGADSDPEGDPLTVSAVNGVAAAVGSPVTLASGALLTLNADGTFSYDPNGQYESLGGGESAADSFTYTLSDGNGGEDSATVTITIDGVNDAPLAADDAVSTNEASVLAGNVLVDNGNGPDSDVEGDVLTVIAVDGTAAAVGQQITLASGALLTLNGDGTFSYDPNGQFDGLGTGESAEDSFTYTLSDGNGGEDTATVTVTVNGVTPDPENVLPVAQNDAFITTENTNLGGNLLTDNGNGPDSDADGDPLSVIEVNGSTANVGTQITLSSGALLSVNANGNFVYFPNGQFDSLGVGESDQETFTYTISDGQGGTATAMATITINGVNDGPVAADDALATDEDTVLNGSVLADNGSEADSDPDGDVLTVSAVNGIAADVGSQITLGSGALLTLNADGTFSYDPSGWFESLGDGEIGLDSFSYTISDGNGGEDTATAVISISGVNDAPEVVSDTAVVVKGVVLAITQALLSASDAETSDPTLITFTVSNQIAGTVLLSGLAAASFTLADVQAGLVTFQHDNSDGAAAGFTVVASDPDGGASAPVALSFTVSAGFVWTNGAGDGDWHNPANWASNSVPGDGAAVVIEDQAGETTFSTGTTALSSMTLAGETLNITGGSLTVTDLTWSGGAFAGAGGTMAVGGAATLSGTLTLDRELTLNGAAELSGAITGSGLLINAGTLVVAGTATLAVAFANVAEAELIIDGGAGGAASLAISGAFAQQGIVTLTASGASGDASLVVTGAPLTNLGAIVVDAGAGGARSIEADLVNNGEMTFNAATVITGAGGAASNEADGVFTANADVTFSGAASFRNSGAMTVAAAATFALVAGDFENATGGVIGGGGTIEVDGTFTNNGTINPGSSPGALAIDGNFVQDAGGQLIVEIDGSGGDLLSVSGTASFAGTIAVTLLNGYVPPAGETITFATAADIIDNGFTVTGLTYTGGLLGLQLDGATASFVAMDAGGDVFVGPDAIIVGNTGIGSLTVDAGQSLFTHYFSVGEEATGAGTFILANASQLSVEGAGYIGRAGSGEATIAGGADALFQSDDGNDLVLAREAGSTGSLVVEGAGTTVTTAGLGNLILVGRAGDGSLQTLDGAAVAAERIDLGYAATGVGTAVVDSASWEVGVGRLRVGREGEGNLTIQNGGVVSTVGGQVDIAAAGGSTGVVNIDATSLLAVDGRFFVGVGSHDPDTGFGSPTQAFGTLNVNGGTVTSGRGILGVNEFGVGVVNIDGGSWTLSANMQIGEEGVGTLNVQNGGVVSVGAGFSSIADAGGSTGEVSVDATSSLSFAGFLSIGHGFYDPLTIPDYGQDAAAFGSLNVLGGSVTAQDSSVGNEARGNGNVLVDGAGSLFGVDETLTIGRAGVGSVTVSNGAILDVGGGAGSGRLDLGGEATGIGSLLLTSGGQLSVEGATTIGNLGSGVAVIDGGADALFQSDNFDNLLIADQAGSAGSLVISGAGTTVATAGVENTVKVGVLGTGTLLVEAGASLATLFLEVGREGIGTVTIQANGTEVAVSNDTGRFAGSFDPNAGIVRVGTFDGGQGAIQVLDGARLEIRNGSGVNENTTQPGLQIARDAGSFGAVLIDGIGSAIEVTQSSPVNPENGIFGPFVQVGRGGDGSLTVQNGGQLLLSAGHADLTLGRLATGSGTLLIDGAGSAVTLEGAELFSSVGREGSGAIVVSNGGALSLLGDGSAFVQMEVGREAGAVGEVLIQGGSEVLIQGGDDNTRLRIARFAGSDGSVIVEGEGSLLSVGGTNEFGSFGNRIEVGNEGTGSLQTLNGATVTAERISIGFAATGVGGALVDNATWQIVGGTLQVGREGNGTLTIQNGGVVTVDAEFSAIGHAGGSSGVVTVDATSSLSYSGYLAIGNGDYNPDPVNGFGQDAEAFGTLNIFGGTVSAQNSGIGWDVRGRGTVLVEGPGALFAVAETLSIGDNGEGSLVVGDGGTAQVGAAQGDDIIDIFIGSGGTLEIQAGGTVIGDIANDGGTIINGNSPGTASFGGDFVMTNGILQVELAGTGAGAFDLYQVAGEVTLQGGILEFSIIDGYAPLAGDTFSFLLAGGGVVVDDEALSFVVSGVAQDFDFDVIFTGSSAEFSVLGGSGTGDSVIFLGGAGDDVFAGGSGNDRLDGGGGQDSLAGGEGADLFILRAADASQSLDLADLISDFEVGVDSLGLADGLAFEDLAITATAGGDAALTLQSSGAFLAVLQGISAAELSLEELTVVA